MSFNHSWPDLSAFNATGRKRTRKGSKRASKVRVTSFDKDGSRVVVEPKPRATRAPKAEPVPAPIDVFITPTLPEPVRFEAPVSQDRRVPSFASRRAAMVARRGY